jgi:hypothetical protein
VDYVRNEVRRSKVNCVVTARGVYSVSVRNIFRERTEESRNCGKLSATLDIRRKCQRTVRLTRVVNFRLYIVYCRTV